MTAPERPPTRRAMLAGVAGLGTAAGVYALLGRRHGEPTLPDRQHIIDTLVEHDPQSILPATAALLARGATVDDLLGAICAAQVTTGSDTDVHVTMMAPAAWRLARGADPTDRALLAMYAMQEAVAWVRADPATPTPTTLPTGPLRPHLFAAMSARDEAAADAATTALLARSGLDETIATLAVAGAAAGTDPHRLIFLHRAVEAGAHLDGPGPELLRAVARYMARTAIPDAPPPAPADDRSVKWGPGDVAATIWASTELPGAASAARSTMLDAVDDVAAERDAMALMAFAALDADPSASGTGVHCLSLAAAGAWAAGQTHTPADARFVLRQVTRWVAEMAPSSAPEPLGPPADDDARIAQARHAAVVNASDMHDLKVTDAAIALVDGVSPSWRRTALSGLPAVRPLRAPAPWPDRDRARALLAEFG